MSGFFCNSPRLQLLERQMRQPPGYRPRGHGWMFDMEEWKSRGNYSEIVDCVISRMQMEHLKKRIQEVFGNAEKELIFYDSRHRNDFSPCGKGCVSGDKAYPAVGADRQGIDTG